jgi:hypothetical protein
MVSLPIIEDSTMSGLGACLNPIRHNGLRRFGGLSDQPTVSRGIPSQSK